MTLASPNATTTTWSQSVTITGNRAMQIRARTVALNGSNDTTKAVKKIETFSTADKTPTASISGPSGVLPSTTFTVNGTATDDIGVSSLSYTMRDVNNRYLQDDGSSSATYNSFRFTPDVVGATSTTWSFDVTVPNEGEWLLAGHADRHDRSVLAGHGRPELDRQRHRHRPDGRHLRTRGDDPADSGQRHHGAHREAR